MQGSSLLFKPVEMHAPDGLLSLPVSLICWLLAAWALALSLRRTRGALGERQVPLIGVMAAFIFAAQMINFPVVGGTSGHLVGGVLAAITLGPWAGMLAMASVIIVQGLLFQDGGLLVMGANLLNMGVLTVAVGYGLYRAVMGRSRPVRLGAAGLAAWLSVMAAALAISLQLWLSGTARLGIVVPAMLGVHALIGAGEALITVAALSFILRTRPDLIEGESQQSGGRGWIAAGVLITFLVVTLSPLASVNPDGLERVTGDLGLIQRSVTSPFQFLPDYTIPFLGDAPLSTVLAGLAGVLVVAFAATRIARLRRSGPVDNRSKT